MSYRDRLLTLKLLPLTFDREFKDLVVFFTNVGMVLLISCVMVNKAVKKKNKKNKWL